MYTVLSIERWIGLRLELVCAIYVAAVAGGAMLKGGSPGERPMPGHDGPEIMAAVTLELKKRAKQTNKQTNKRARTAVT